MVQAGATAEQPVQALLRGEPADVQDQPVLQRNTDAPARVRFGNRAEQPKVHPAGHDRQLVDRGAVVATQILHFPPGGDQDPVAGLDYAAFGGDAGFGFGRVRAQQVLHGAQGVKGGDVGDAPCLPGLDPHLPG